MVPNLQKPTFSPSGGATPLSRKDYGVLAAVLILAFVIRLLGIPGRELWYDELFSVSYATQPFGNIVPSILAYDPHPPLYYLQLRLWMAPSTEVIWLRLNTILWSLSAIPPTYLVGRRLFGNLGGFYSAVILSLSPLAIFFAQEIRMYAMQMSLAAFNLFFLERLLADKIRRSDAFLFFITLVMASYTQGAGFLILASVSAYCLLRLRFDIFQQRFRLIALAIFLAALCVLPWLFQAEGTNLRHLRTYNLNEIPNVLLRLLLGPETGSFPPVLLIVVFLVAACILGGLVATPHTRNLAIAYLLVPFILVLALAYLVVPLWHHKALAWLLPTLSILFSGAITALHQRFEWLRLAIQILALSTITAVLLPPALSVNRNQAHSPLWRMHYDVAVLLNRETRPGDVVAVEDWGDFWSLAWFLAGPGSVDLLDKSSAVSLPNNRWLVKQEIDNRSGMANWRIDRLPNAHSRIYRQQILEEGQREDRFGWLVVHRL